MTIEVGRDPQESDMPEAKVKEVIQKGGVNHVKCCSRSSQLKTKN